MSKKEHFERGMAIIKAGAERFSEDRAMVVRVCHAVSGTCVMALNSPRIEDCNVDNCAAWRAAFGQSEEPHV